MKVGFIVVGQIDSEEFAMGNIRITVVQDDEHVLLDFHSLIGETNENGFHLGLHVGHLNGELPVNIRNHCRFLVADDAHGGSNDRLAVRRINDSTTDGHLCIGHSRNEKE